MTRRSWFWTIPLEPIGKGRPRVSTRGGRARAYTPSKTRVWEALAAWHLGLGWAAPPLDEPLVLEVLAVFERPKRLLRKDSPAGRIPHTVKPDNDNCEKVVADSLVKAGVVRDDCLFCDGGTRKVYAAHGEDPHVEVTVRTIDDEQRSVDEMLDAAEGEINKALESRRRRGLTP